MYIKKLLTFIVLLSAFGGLSWAYDFSAVTPSGQTLYYNISGGAVSVTYPGASIEDPYADHTGPSGELTIPSTVTYNNQTYSVSAIGNYAFADCYELSSVTIPNSVTSIGNRSFRYCFGLTSITIPNSVTSIGNRTFFGCIGLTSITIPNSVTEIGGWAFADCSGLISITIPNSVTSISDQLFFYCRSLTSVTIPNTVTSIGEWAFRGCSGLISITIPHSVTSIGGGAFTHCIGLTEITCLASEAPLLGEDVFFDVPSTIPVYIPCGSGVSYQSCWGCFTNIVESTGFSFSATTADSTQGIVQVLTEPTCATPTAVINAVANTGYRFDHWSDGESDNPRSIVLTSDTTITAYFDHTQGIDDAAGKEGVVIRAIGGLIVVEGIANETVRLFDCMGRCLQVVRADEGCTFQVPVPGIYILQAGRHPAQRVVVMR